MKWDYQHFSPHEVECHCKKCEGKDTHKKIHKRSMEMLVRARIYSGSLDHNIRYNLTCAYRCLSHNRSLGSKDNSEHVQGRAFDIPFNNDYEKFLIVYGLTVAGFKRMKIYTKKKFIHADTSINKDKSKYYLGND
jgi:uncharacterized protein YcbK (DUF882 family)